MNDLTTEILTKPKELSEDQKRVVLSKSRYIRVIAGAGAGKTETLTRRIAFLLLVEKAEPSSIVAFTFTEKAAQAMKSRIYQRVKELKGPLNMLGEMYIGTIHAYAKRLLEDQVRLYVMGLNGIGKDVGRASVAYLEESDVRPVEVGEAEMRQAREMADRTVERIIRREFGPTPGSESCRRCDHTRICRWRA